ncbi:MAG: hypothetical protein JKY40_10515 [Gammaproteobacteria bacterium]|nr:hypothetical protein [Gammaproteobacteria bacterium]
MSALKFELGVLTPEGKMLLRDFDYHQVVKSIAWLKKMNTGGSEIYIRPKGSVGIILMDDIDLGVLKLLKDNSLSPACVVETSPQNLQAWIRFSVKPVSEQTATAVAQFLAHKYNADLTRLTGDTLAA